MNLKKLRIGNVLVQSFLQVKELFKSIEVNYTALELDQEGEDISIIFLQILKLKQITLIIMYQQYIQF